MSANTLSSSASSPVASLTLARLATLAVWLAGGAVVVYWGLKLLAWSSSAAAPAPVTPPLPVAEEASVARLLGAAPGPAAAAAPSSRAQLTLAGVVARADGGAALIAINGAPAQPFRPGQVVADGYTAGSLDTQRAVLVQQGHADWTLDMPQEYASKVGAGGAARTLRPAGSPGAAAAPAPVNAGANAASRLLPPRPPQR